MTLLNPIIDKLQALFPPNRVAILFAGIITAVSGSIAAWLAVHFPGLSFGSVEIAGVLGAAVIVTVRLLDRWFDRWQEGERVDYQGDVEAALEELSSTPDARALFDALGTFDGVGQAIGQLRAQIEAGTIGTPEISDELSGISDVVLGFLRDYRPELLEQLDVATPPAGAAQ